MKEYHKIQTVFLRSPESKFKNLMEGVWALPEFELLKDVDWVWTEKIDGTNIRIMWDGEGTRFGGKTDDAQIPTVLLKELQDVFTPEKMKSVLLHPPAYTEKDMAIKSKKSGRNYLPDTAAFILFDARVGEYWLERENIEDIASKLDIPAVPVVGKGSLLSAIELVKKGFISTIASDKSLIAEGLIMKPAIELFNRKGERIVAKIKHRDFMIKK